MINVNICWCQRHDITPGTYRHIVTSSAFRECEDTITGYPDDKLFNHIHSNMGQWSNQIALETTEDQSSVTKILEREFLGREY